MIIVVTFILMAALLIFGVYIVDGDYKYDSELSTWIGAILAAFGILLGIVFVIMSIIVVGDNCGIEGQKAELEQRYESLVYQFENDIYDNDNDLGKKELYNQVQEWNETLAKNKIYQRNFWIGCFYPNIYDDLEFIKYDSKGY